MKRSSALVFGFVLVVVAVVLALAVPGSPVYLPKLIKSPVSYEGHTSTYWIQTATDSPVKEERLGAVKALAVIGAEDPGAIPALAKVMTDDADRDARLQAAFALTRIDPKLPAMAEAVPALAKALADKELPVRMNAAMALNRMEPTAARAAIPALRQAVEDKANDTNAGMHYVTIQEMAAMALGRASAGTADAVPLLRALLVSAKTAEARQARVRAVGFVGPAARAALPELRAMFLDPGQLAVGVGLAAAAEPWRRDTHVRENLEEAIQNIEGRGAAAKGP